ncbi:MAG: glycosyltransferase [Nitrospirae bacterium]|nr:glycosyltransferase [Nitrospirota bacterium]
MTISFVIATKDRPHDLESLLKNLADQACRPDQLIIVDASKTSNEAMTKRYSSCFDLQYIKYTASPSASAQRNAGIRAVRNDIDLVGFLDDDVVLEKGAMGAMLFFWQTTPEDVAGCAFNLRNFEPAGAEGFKHTGLAQMLGLYSRKKGVVMPSGWQTMIGTVGETIYVEWLPIGASVWRRQIFDLFQFEEYFSGYSYLEDLDFSYSVSRRYRLAVVADAGFYHYHSPSGRISAYRFGKVEVRNRVYFVRKHKLSLALCYVGIISRLLITCIEGMKTQRGDYFKRALGNFVGMGQFFFLSRQSIIEKKEKSLTNNR